MNIPNPRATAANAPMITPAATAVATKNNEPTIDPMIAAIANSIAALSQNLNNLAAAVNATNANFDHLTAMINQGPAAGGGGGRASGGEGGGRPGGGVGGRPVHFALSPGHAKDNLVINYHKKHGSSLYNAMKDAVAIEFHMSKKTQ